MHKHEFWEPKISLFLELWKNRLEAKLQIWQVINFSYPLLLLHLPLNI